MSTHSEHHQRQYEKGIIDTTDGKPPIAFNPGAPGNIGANGQHAQYWVLSEAERANGFVRPVRTSYIHAKCGTVTTMGRAIAETYARDPTFYGATMCVSCGGHFPVGPDGQFTWERTDEKVAHDGRRRRPNWQPSRRTGRDYRRATPAARGQRAAIHRAAPSLRGTTAKTRGRHPARYQSDVARQADDAREKAEQERDAVIATAASLQAENAGLRADKERMDWLSEPRESLTIGINQPGLIPPCSLYVGNLDDPIDDNTLRAAIDRARLASTPPQERP